MEKTRTMSRPWRKLDVLISCILSMLALWAMVQWGAMPVFLVGMGIICVALTLPKIREWSRKRKSRKTKTRIAATTKEYDITVDIDARVEHKLATVYGEDIRYRWSSHPSTATGMGRIEVLFANGTRKFMDVCFKENGYLALHVTNVYEVNGPEDIAAKADRIVASKPVETSSLETPKPPAPSAIPLNSPAGVEKWFNIVFYNALEDVIADLNVKGDLCLTIKDDGKVYDYNSAVIYNFEEMPPVMFWDVIAEKLGNEGLYAEVQEDSVLFISWPQED